MVYDTLNESQQKPSETAQYPQEKDGMKQNDVQIEIEKGKE